MDPETVGKSASAITKLTVSLFICKLLSAFALSYLEISILVTPNFVVPLFSALNFNVSKTQVPFGKLSAAKPEPKATTSISPVSLLALSP